MKTFSSILILTLGPALFFANASLSGASESRIVNQQARGLFERLTGRPLLMTDPRLTQMSQLISASKFYDAAEIATNDESFYRGTVKNFSAVMSTHDETILAPLNDFQATVIGAVRDNLDARTLLTGNYVYTVGRARQSANSNAAYESASPENNPSPELKTALTKTESANTEPGFTPAGLMTTRSWAEAHFNMGTNRRAVEYAFREFLCTPISQWKDANLPDMNVRRDIDRAPGGDPRTFQKQCRTCHAPMDGLAGAFARFDFVNGALVFTGADKVADKYNQKTNVYPQGYVTFDDSWINRATLHHNSNFGWAGITDGAITGKGATEFGAMIANSGGFKTCMARRVFRTLCHRDASQTEQALISRAAREFSDDQYSLKKMFQKVALAPECEFDSRTKKKVAGIKNFNQFFESMRAVTAVDGARNTEIMNSYRASMARLPKEGRIDELTAPVMLTYTALAGQFCKAAGDAYMRGHPQADEITIVNDLAAQFWGRAAKPTEMNQLKRLSAGAGDRGFYKKTCTVMATSLDFIYN